MSLIEGIGDEVIQFIVAALVGLVVLLAWWSTGYTPPINRRFRTVVIMERNARRLYNLMPRITGNPHQNGVTVYHWTAAPIQPSLEAAPANSNNSSNASEEASPQDAQIDTDALVDTNSQDIIDNVSESTNEVNQVNSDTDSITTEQQTLNSTNDSISTQEMEMDRIVNAMESVACTLRNRRLAYFENQPAQDSDSKPSAKTDTESASTSTQSTDSTENNSEENKESLNEDKSEDVEDTTNPNNIRIRLKYINDDQKLVEGSLNEPLGEFKRRHFRGEMSARKLVRLIFNGQVLQREAATLASCGLFDNCVVHCLIHQPRTPGQFAQVQQQLNPQPTSPEGSTATNNHGQNVHIHNQTQMPTVDVGERDDRDWDLSHILLTILASILSIAWYCHIRFSSLFGVAASVAMLGLTALYIFAVICVYYPEAANNEAQQMPSATSHPTTQQQQQTTNAN